MSTLQEALRSERLGWGVMFGASALMGGLSAWAGEAIAILLILGLGLAALLRVAPRDGVFLMFFSVAYAFGYIIIAGSSLVIWSGLLVVGMAFARALIGREGLPLEARSYGIAAGLFLVSQLISTSFAVDLSESVFVLKTFVGGVAIATFLVPLFVKDRETLWRVIKVFLALAVLDASMGLLQTFVSSSFSPALILPSSLFESENMEATLEVLVQQGTLMRPSGISAYFLPYAKNLMLAFLVMASLHFGKILKARERMYLIGSLMLVGLGILTSGTRSALLGTLLGLGVLFALRLKRSDFKVLLNQALRLMILIIPMVVVLQSTGFLNKMFFEGRDESSITRVALAYAAVSMVADHPVFGVGPGNFRKHSAHYLPNLGVELDFRVESLPAHNVFLEILTGSGVVGLSLYVALFIMAFRNFWLAQHRSADPLLSALSAGLAAALAAYLVESSLHNHFKDYMVWFLFGFSIVLRSLANRTEIPPREVQ